jgi:alkylmercury lyase-like protein
MRMDERDLEIRNATYGHFVELGRAPLAGQVARSLGQSEDEVRAAWRRLHDAHALVLDEAGDIRMANPFSGVKTPYVVEADGRRWYANCGWDAFGIGAALHVDSLIETACADCQEPLRIEIHDGRPDTEDLVFHVLVPAAAWWDDIGYT